MMKILLLLLLVVLLPTSAPAQSTDVVIASRQNYTPGVREVGPFSLPVGTKSITLQFDTANHTQKTTTWFFQTFLSRDGGVTWTKFIGFGRRLGGTAEFKPASYTFPISPVADANTRIKGTFELIGGNLNTEVKVTLR